MGAEAAVGPHRELTGGPGITHSAQRLPQEVSGAPGGDSPALTQPGHQHLTGAGGHGQQRVIATLAGVAVAACSLLGQAVVLADGRVQVDGQRQVARAITGGPGPGQQFPAHLIHLPDMAQAEAAQEGAQRGRLLGHVAQHPPRAAGTQGIDVVDAVAAGQRGGYQDKHLVARVGPARGISQVNVLVRQIPKTQAQGQGRGQHQPRVGHQAVMVDGDVDAVGVDAW